MALISRCARERLCACCPVRIQLVEFADAPRSPVRRSLSTGSRPALPGDVCRPVGFAASGAGPTSSLEELGPSDDVGGTGVDAEQDELPKRERWHVRFEGEP